MKAAAPGDAGELLVRTLLGAMRATGVPMGVGALGYGEGDVEALARGAIVQRRLVDNAPIAVDDDGMRAFFRGAMAY